MSEYRHDPLCGSSVIIAPERLDRPDEFRRSARGEPEAAQCPFCAGQEHQTPPALAVYQAPDRTATEPWQVRVVPNRYPAVSTSVCNATVPAASAVADPWSAPAVGSHEVVIESPRHVSSFSQLTDEQARFTFLAYGERIRALKRNPQLASAHVFKNVHADGGASLEHSHSQLIATGVVPLDLQRELAAAGAYRLAEQGCFFCRMLAASRSEGTRWITETEHFAVCTPFASRLPFETWVLPRAHRPCFEETPADQIEELAFLVREMIARLERTLDEPAYNYWLSSAPFAIASPSDYHWRLVLVPRLTQLAGYELGTGCFINPVAPEEAAQRLRTA